MKKRRVAIIGHFGGGNKFTDGQTVKTFNLYNELKNYTNWTLQTVDTYYVKHNPLRLIGDTITALFTSKDIIILLSGNGMRIYFPLLSFCATVFHKKIYHDVIGGNLAEYYIKRYPKYKKYLNNFKVNWIETQKLKTDLENIGINNVEIIPNFRRFETVKEHELRTQYNEPYYFCTFSRVRKEKGIEEAIRAVQSINKKAGRELCKLDIYGPVDPQYKNQFEKIMQAASDAIKYKGEVDFKSAINTLKQYYGLLFPTYWDGEGQAGTISESLIAGVPVLATDWHCNSEMIKNEYNGLLYPCDLAENLEQAISWLIDLNKDIVILKKNCIKSAEYYHPEHHMKRIIARIQDT